MILLEAYGLTVQYGDKTILQDVDFTLKAGQWLMVVGPNGAGKSTLVKVVSQTIPYTGEVLYKGHDIRRFKAHEIARRIGVLAQTYAVGYAFTVGEVVRLGRYAYAPGAFSRKPKDDEQHVRRALELTGMTDFVHRQVTTLSGGELQRAFLAQVLAQNPKILILDEPTNHLDLVYQEQVFSLISNWLKVEERAAISVVHDLSLAKAYGTHGLLLKNGICLAQGQLNEVFKPEHLTQAYSMDVGRWMRRMLGQWEAV